MSSVLVLDADQRATLAITRSLGRQGVCVYTADAKPQALAGQSKYSAGYFILPPMSNPAKFNHSVKKIIADHNIDTLLPVTDLSMQYFMIHRDEFEAVGLPLNPDDAINTLSDKSKLASLAKELDIPVPTTWKVGANEPIDSILSDLKYPLVVKPAKSRTIIRGRVIAPEVTYANTEVDLIRLLQDRPEYRQVDLLLQQYVRGKGHGVFLLTDKGEQKAIFSHRRLRERPPSGGVSVLSESVAINKKSADYAIKLLQAVSWSGVAMVEFKLTDSGEIYLIEVNTRFWGSLQLAVDAGVDFPYLFYQMLNNQPIETLVEYSVGQRLRWLLGDVDYLYLLMTGKSQSLGGESRCRAIFAFLNFFSARTKFEVNRLDDFRPFIYELKSYFK